MDIIIVPRVYHYYLPSLVSPTNSNLAYYLSEAGWIPTQFCSRAQFTEQHLDFDSDVAKCIEYKHLLANLVNNQLLTITPKTYAINDNNWMEIFLKLEPGVWILKPSMLNNGQHIHIFKNKTQLLEHYMQSNRMGGYHVLQHYITQPHLLKGPKAGHKYTLRLFLVLSTHKGAFLYQHGYFNIALKPYVADDYSDLCPHLTNEHLTPNQSNVIQIPTHQYALFNPLYPKIKTILKVLTSRLQDAYPYRSRTDTPHRLAIFGCDFLVDVDERVWLLEANHAPCFPTAANHPLQKSLYEGFWRAFIHSFILPKTQVSPLFENIHGS